MTSSRLFALVSAYNQKHPTARLSCGALILEATKYLDDTPLLTTDKLAKIEMATIESLAENACLDHTSDKGLSLETLKLAALAYVLAYERTQMRFSHWCATGNLR